MIPVEEHNNNNNKLVSNRNMLLSGFHGNKTIHSNQLTLWPHDLGYYSNNILRNEEHLPIAGSWVSNVIMVNGSLDKPT